MHFLLTALLCCAYLRGAGSARLPHEPARTLQQAADGGPPTVALSASDEVQAEVYQDAGFGDVIYTPQNNKPFDKRSFVSSRVFNPKNFTLGRLEVQAWIRHPNLEELRLHLRSPWGTQMVLMMTGFRAFTPEGQDLWGTRFSDAATASLHGLRTATSDERTRDLYYRYKYQSWLGPRRNRYNGRMSFPPAPNTPPHFPSPPPIPALLSNNQGFSGTWRPDSPFAATVGEGARGEWTLTAMGEYATTHKLWNKSAGWMGIVDWSLSLWEQEASDCTVDADPFSFLTQKPAVGWGVAAQGPGAGRVYAARTCRGGCALEQLVPADQREERYGGTGDAGPPLVCLHGASPNHLYRVGDTGSASMVPTITTSLDFTVSRVEVLLEVTHRWVADLSIILQSPQGTNVTLLTPGSWFTGMRSVDLRQVVFSDRGDRNQSDPYDLESCLEQPGPYMIWTCAKKHRVSIVPERPLLKVAGEGAKGVWKLFVEDQAAEGSLYRGYVDFWQLWLWPEECNPERGPNAREAMRYLYGAQHEESLYIGCTSACPAGTVLDEPTNMCVWVQSGPNKEFNHPPPNSYEIVSAAVEQVTTASEPEILADSKTVGFEFTLINILGIVAGSVAFILMCLLCWKVVVPTMRHGGEMFTEMGDINNLPAEKDYEDKDEEGGPKQEGSADVGNGNSGVIAVLDRGNGVVGVQIGKKPSKTRDIPFVAVELDSYSPITLVA